MDANCEDGGATENFAMTMLGSLGDIGDKSLRIRVWADRVTASSDAVPCTIWGQPFWDRHGKFVLLYHFARLALQCHIPVMFCTGAQEHVVTSVGDLVTYGIG